MITLKYVVMVSFFLSIKFNSCPDLGLNKMSALEMIEALKRHALSNIPCWIMVVPNRLKTEEMFKEAVHMDPCSLEFLPECLKTEKMCNEAVRRNEYTLYYVPDHLLTQKMCNEAMCEYPSSIFACPRLF